MKVAEKKAYEITDCCCERMQRLIDIECIIYEQLRPHCHFLLYSQNRSIG